LNIQYTINPIINVRTINEISIKANLFFSIIEIKSNIMNVILMITVPVISPLSPIIIQLIERINENDITKNSEISTKIVFEYIFF